MFQKRNVLFILTWASDVTILYENDAFSMLVLSPKKRLCSFLKNVFIFQKIYSKVKKLKLLKISIYCHIKTCRSFKRRVILRSLVPFFRRIYALYDGFKMKSIKKVFPSVKTKKPIQILA